MNMKNWLGRAVFGAVLSFTGLVMAADWPANVTNIASEKGKSVTVSGKLESGRAHERTTSPGLDEQHGVLPRHPERAVPRQPRPYHTQIPPRSIMTITVTPKDTTKDLSIYAYTIGTTSTSVPPNVSSAVSYVRGRVQVGPAEARPDAGPHAHCEAQLRHQPVQRRHRCRGREGRDRGRLRPQRSTFSSRQLHQHVGRFEGLYAVPHLPDHVLFWVAQTPSQS